MHPTTRRFGVHLFCHQTAATPRGLSLPFGANCFIEETEVEATFALSQVCDVTVCDATTLKWPQHGLSPY